MEQFPGNWAKAQCTYNVAKSLGKVMRKGDNDEKLDKIFQMLRK